MQSDNSRVFKPRAAFDGVKNLFMTKELEQAQVSTTFESLNSYSQVTQFNVNMGNPNKTTGIYSVRLTLVGKINPRYVRCWRQLALTDDSDSDIEKLTTSRGADSPITINNENTIALTLLQVILSQGPQLYVAMSHSGMVCLTLIATANIDFRFMRNRSIFPLMR